MNLLRLLLLSLVVAAGGCNLLRQPHGTGEVTAGPGEVIYTTVAGDTISSIAEKFRVPVETIINANHLDSTTLFAGTRLRIPGGAAPVAAPAPAPVSATVAAPAPAAWYVPRSAWSVEEVDESNVVPMAPIYRITVHHSGTPSDADSDPVATLRRIEHQHKHDRHWAAIGYEFVIATDGTVYEARPIKWQGAHSTGDNNIGNIGICLLGDFDGHAVPAAQKAALIAALDRLRAQYHIPQGNVYGHRELKLTDCPGKYLMQIVVDYRGGRPDQAVGDAVKKDD
jgi:LysM repeat protein